MSSQGIMFNLISLEGMQIPHADGLPDLDPETQEPFYWVEVERRFVRDPELQYMF